jgi:hypothetical protein
MSEWNYDMDAAPRGRYVKKMVKTPKGMVEKEVHEPDLIIATEGTIVTLCKWLPPITTGPEAHRRGSRWTMFATWETPLAWMPWPKAPNKKSTEEKSADELSE